MAVLLHNKKKNYKRVQMKSNFVSIISVNYNGIRYLKTFLESLQNLDYRKKNLEVIVVDNGSNDGSVKFINENFPNVKVIESPTNLGFGRGNNLGIKQAKGDLIFLVNNDTLMDRGSLKNAVKTFNKWKKSKKIGAINAKMVLVDKYLPFKIEEAFFSGYKVSEKYEAINLQPYVLPHETSKLFTERVLVPINHNMSGDMNLRLTLKPFRRSNFYIYLGNKIIYKGKFDDLGKEKTVNFSLSHNQLKKETLDLIQNAGNYYFRDGFGRDRGALVFKHKQFYEEDKGQYDREEFVPGFCGAGVLLYKKALNETGLFDDNFFMYYEDADLSFRLKRKKWKILYSPSVSVRHIHSGSSKEWSDFFTFNVERGRLLFVSKHWPRDIAVTELLKYVVKDMFIVPTYYLLHKDIKNARKRLATRLRVVFSLVPAFLAGLFETGRLSKSELKDFM